MLGYKTPISGAERRARMQARRPAGVGRLRADVLPEPAEQFTQSQFADATQQASNVEMRPEYDNLTYERFEREFKSEQE